MKRQIVDCSLSVSLFRLSPSHESLSVDELNKERDINNSVKGMACHQVNTEDKH